MLHVTVLGTVPVVTLWIIWLRRSGGQFPFCHPWARLASASPFAKAPGDKSRLAARCAGGSLNTAGARLWPAPIACGVFDFQMVLYPEEGAGADATPLRCEAERTNGFSWELMHSLRTPFHGQQAGGVAADGADGPPSSARRCFTHSR